MSELIIGTDENEGYWYTGEEIVRCRECRRFHPRESSLFSCRFELDNGLVQWRYAEPDGFCAWPEKKEGCK